jgi:C4-dicarboxylate-specific signal transduction histidine kinase
MTETIEEFLKFFKGDISDVNVTLKQVLDRPHRLMESAFIDYGVEYQYKSSFRDDTELILCESRFNQVLINIYQNSLDAMIESNIKEGKILVSIYEENSKIIFEIKDNAGGIKDDVLPKIFDPYFSTKSKNGTGIGLYMSKLIVENNLLGDIEAFNIDDGVCFKIILPLIK